MTRKRVAVFAAATAIGIIALTACGKVEAGKPVADPNALGQQAADFAMINVGEVPDLGPVATDETGRTLYRFDGDTASPNTVSNCNGECTETWEPATVVADTVTAKGVDQSLVGWVDRSDGQKQLVIAGWPQYRYKEDTAPGEAKGHNKQDKWFVTAPDGQRVGQQQKQPDAGGAEAPVAATGVVSGLGTILTGADGRTLYRFDNDNNQPPTSNCDGDCAKAWPPLVVDTDKPAVSGVDPSLVGVLTRKDGTKQLTIAGWAQYYFAKDAKPGQAQGQNVQRKWFATAPDGKKAQENKAIEVTTATVGNLGVLATDKEGMTLYRFDSDSNEPPASNCDGDCATKWPPAIVSSDKPQVQGIDQALIGTITRADGKKQLTIDGWPQYTFAGDKLCGEANGQGVGGTWWATKADGSRAN